MKKSIFLLLYLLGGCQGIEVPDSFTYQEIKTPSYTLASWQKITDTTAPIRIYIEGDGHAFNYAGQPSPNPTPRSPFLRQIAFQDPNPNVVYLARPCQYVKDPVCTPTDWTNGRFSKEIVRSSTQAIESFTKDRPLILIGYSGGALLSGLVIEQNPDLNVQKWITIAGLLNHTKWTNKLNLLPLDKSMDLNKLPHLPQKHYFGEKDKTIPADLYTDTISPDSFVIVKGATHDAGFQAILPLLYKE